VREETMPKKGPHVPVGCRHLTTFAQEETLAGRRWHVVTCLEKRCGEVVHREEITPAQDRARRKRR
jgi:hypothetical protein